MTHAAHNAPSSPVRFQPFTQTQIDAIEVLRKAKTPISNRDLAPVVKLELKRAADLLRELARRGAAVRVSEGRRCKETYAAQYVLAPNVEVLPLFERVPAPPREKKQWPDRCPTHGIRYVKAGTRGDFLIGRCPTCSHTAELPQDSAGARRIVRGY